MLGIFSKSKAISTRLAPFEQEQFLARVKAQKRSVADVLREAVIFYLDNYDTLQKDADKLSEPEQNTRKELESNKLLALDYDDVGPGPRMNRFLWGG